MPSEELISSIIDTAAIKKEVDNVEALLTNLEQRLQAIKEFKTQIQLSVNSSEVIAATQGANKAMQDLSNSAKDTTKTIGNLAGEYSKLKQQYADGIRDAKNLAAQFGVNSQQAKEAAASVATLRDRLSEIDKFVGGKKIISVETQTTSPTDVPFSNNLDAIEKEKQALQEKGDVLSELDRQQAEAANSATALGTAQEEASKKTKTSAGDIFAEKTALETLNGSRKENITTLLKYQAELASNKAQQKSIDADLKAGTITQKEYNASKIALVAREKELKVATGELSRTIQSQTKEILAVESSYDQLNARLGQMRDLYRQMSVAERESDIGKKLAADIVVADTEIKKLDAGMGNYQRNVGNYSGAFTGYANTLRGLRGPTKLLGEALGIGAQEADQFRIVIEHAFQGIAAFFRSKEEKARIEIDAAKKAAVATTESTIATNANTSATNKNTIAAGTNSTAIEGNVVVTEGAAVAQGELAVATTTSSIAMRVFRAALLSTGIGILIGLIAFAVQKYRDYKEAAEKAAEKQKLFNDVVAEANKNAAKEIETAKDLKAAAEDTANSTEKRLKAVKKLRDEFPEYFKDLSDEQILNGKVGETYQKLTKDIEANARALAAKSKIDELVSQQLDLEYQREKVRNAVSNEKAAAKDKNLGQEGGGFEKGTGGKTVVYTAEEQRADAEARRKRAEGDINDKKQTLQRQIDFLKKFVGGETAIGNAIVSESEKKPKKEKDPSNKDYYIDALKAQEEAKVAQLEIQRDLDESLAKNDKENFLVREDALKSFVAVSIQILEEQKKYALLINDAKTQEELKKENLTVKQIADIRAAGNDGRLKIEAEFQKKASKVRLDGIKDEEALQVQKAKELLALAEKTALERDRIEREGREKRLNEELTFLEEVGELKINANIRQLNTEQGVLLDQYEKGKISKEKYEKELLKLQTKYARLRLELELQVAQSQLQELKPGDAQYDKVVTQISNIQAALKQLGKKSNDDSKDQLLKTLQEIKQISDQVATSIQGVLDAVYEKQKALIQGQIDEIERGKNAELKANDATTASTQDKANNVALIEARAQAKKEELQRRQNDIDNKKAKADRVFQIFNIIGNTALAVTKSVAESPETFGLPFSAVAAAIGAAQIAAVLAQPLPHYRKGKNVSNFDNYEGPAIWGEERSEMKISKDGTIEISPNRPTLTHVKKDDIILPDASKINYLPNFDTSIPTDKYREVLNHAAISATLRMGGANVSPSVFDTSLITAMQSKLDQTNFELRNVKSAIENIPGVKITNTWSGLQVSYKSQAGWDEYINKYFKS